MADQRQQNQNQQQGKQQENQKKGKGRTRLPLVRSLMIGWFYMITVMDEAILAAVFTLPVWGICYAMKVEHIALPTDFLTLWAISFAQFMLQNAMFRRREQGS